jgi:hypothetical protein
MLDRFSQPNGQSIVDLLKPTQPLPSLTNRPVRLWPGGSGIRARA